jgi:hypothetical protein
VNNSWSFHVKILYEFLAVFHSVSHPDISAKHFAHGHSVTILLNVGGVTTVSHKYSPTITRHAIVVVDVASTVHYLDNYKIKYIISDNI